jgi:hypothetical protein
MAYVLKYRDEVCEYLAAREELSHRAKEKVFQLLELHLGENGDAYRNNPALRLKPGSECFGFDVLFPDPDDPARLHLVQFYVSDRAAEYGVLAVVYADLRN